MAFKDVRDLTEHLHQLDYPHRFTISTLASPHGCLATFGIVARILQWLAARLEPGALLAGSAATEQERIALVRSAAEFFVTRASLRLNPRRLYASSAATAGELLKVTQLLIRAPQQAATASSSNGTDNDEDTPDTVALFGSGSAIDLGDRLDELRRARELSAELTQSGASLYDLLAAELLNRERRTVQASRPLELAAVERAMRSSVAQLTQRVQQARHQLETARGERAALQSKADRKAGELDRLRQRLGALQKIRPAFLEEFERLEIELQALFVQYALRVRCLDALRVQVANRARVATAKRVPEWPELARQQQEGVSMTFLAEGLIDSDDGGDGVGGGGETMGRRGGGDHHDDDDDDDMRAVNELMARGQNRRRDVAMAEAANMIRESKTATRLRVRTAAAKQETGKRFVGNMTGGDGGSDDDDSSLVSDDNGSYSDLDLAGGGLPMSDVDVMDDDDEDDGDEALLRRAEGGGGQQQMMTAATAAAEVEPRAGKAKPTGIVMSDEDF